MITLTLKLRTASINGEVVADRFDVLVQLREALSDAGYDVVASCLARKIPARADGGVVLERARRQVSFLVGRDVAFAVTASLKKQNAIKPLAHCEVTLSDDLFSDIPRVMAVAA